MGVEETTDLEELRVADDELWTGGPPHETFKRLRSECPVHWSDGLTNFPDDAGYWSVTKAEDVHTCLLYTSPSPRDGLLSRMPSSA